MLKALRRFWALALVVALATFAGLLVALALTPKSYTSTALVAMVPRPDAVPGGELLRLSLPGYAQLATSQVTAVDLAGRFDLDAGSIEDNVSAQIPPASNTLLLSATWSDPATAARLANGLADVVRQATAGDQLLSASPLAEALPPAAPSWPPWGASVVVGGLVALAAGVVTAVVADRRRPLLASPAQVVGLLEDEGLSVPVLLSGSAPGGAAAAIATAVEHRWEHRDEAGIPRLALAVVGEDAQQGLTLAAGVAAEIARRGRRVLLLVDERDAALLDRSSVTSALALTSPGTVTLGVGASPDEVERHGPPGTAVDVLVQVIDGIEAVVEPGSSRQMPAVVPVIGLPAPTRQVRSTLRLLRESRALAPAVCCLLPSPTDGRSSRQKVSDAPSRPGSASSDEAPESGPEQPSRAETGRSS
jgi:hypothetical protein